MSNLVRLIAPAGTDECNYGQVRYHVHEDMHVDVPQEAVDGLTRIGGFVIAPVAAPAAPAPAPVVVIAPPIPSVVVTESPALSVASAPPAFMALVLPMGRGLAVQGRVRARPFQFPCRPLRHGWQG
jgi:hypothetical protein